MRDRDRMCHRLAWDICCYMSDLTSGIIIIIYLQKNHVKIPKQRGAFLEGVDPYLKIC